MHVNHRPVSEDLTFIRSPTLIPYPTLPGCLL